MRSQAEYPQKLYRAVGQIDFPPPQAMACGSLERVMVVVPALAETQDRDPPIVLGHIGRLKRAVTQTWDAELTNHVL